MIDGIVGWETDTWYPDRRIADGMPRIDQGTQYKVDWMTRIQLVQCSFDEREGMTTARPD